MAPEGDIGRGTPEFSNPGKKRRQKTSSRERLQQVELLLKISRRSGMEALEELLDAVIEQTSQAIGCDRSTFFLFDSGSNELFSRTAQGLLREIRLSSSEGVAGAVFRSGEPLIVHDAYNDPRFNVETDQLTGYHTKNLLCVPLRGFNDAVIGVAQCLNKHHGEFNERDRDLLLEIGHAAVPSLRSSHFIERMTKAREQEMEFLNVIADITSQIELDALLQRVMAEATRMLDAERSTLFLHDEKAKELFSRVAQGATVGEIRLPEHAGIAGAVFTTGETINIPHAYADLRFNPAFDKLTGFFTRSILCTPLTNKYGKVIGVTQALNKHGGPFTEDDEKRLRAFTAEVAIALENAKLFNDVQKMKNYIESVLLSMSNGVVTLNQERVIVTCNAAGLRIFQCAAEDILDKKVDEFFTAKNAWMVERICKVEAEQRADVQMDTEIEVGGKLTAVNLTVQPLKTDDDQNLGTMLVIEDISTEKRVKATMARYMDATIAAQLVENSEGYLLGGVSQPTTILFSDIRGFTTLTEHLGAQGTVAFLNEYFEIMVEAITKQEGMLDKFIGDAIMAAFGLPIAHEDDEDRAVRAAIAMIRGCWQWNEERLRRGDLPVDMGIGLNTDVVVSGNIGSAKRMDYTLIGDGVNVASRLESACKAYSARILISDNTFKKLRGTYRVRDVDQVIVKGKTEPVGVYEVLDYHSEETFPKLMDVVNYFNEGITYYRKRNFKPAIKRFEAALERNPRDKLSRTYIERCELLLENPPPEEWAGIWEMHEK